MWAEGRDPLYAVLLKAHWVEEAQHTKSDMLATARLAEAMNAEELSVVFDDLRAIGGLVDAALVGQAEKEIETLVRVTGRTFTDAEDRVLRDSLHRSLSDNLTGVGLSHPRFRQV